MGLQKILNERELTKYRLSKISGVPKTTIFDLCSGKTSIELCTAKNVLQIAKALNITMEDLMDRCMNSDYEAETGLPKDKRYLECGLPKYLEQSLNQMKLAWEKIDFGEEYLQWDADYCTLQSDINNAEVSGRISEEQAWYLREEYLRIERGEIND